MNICLELITVNWLSVMKKGLKLILFKLKLQVQHLHVELVTDKDIFQMHSRKSENHALCRDSVGYNWNIKK